MGLYEEGKRRKGRERCRRRGPLGFLGIFPGIFSVLSWSVLVVRREGEEREEREKREVWFHVRGRREGNGIERSASWSSRILPGISSVLSWSALVENGERKERERKEIERYDFMGFVRWGREKGMGEKGLRHGPLGFPGIFPGILSVLPWSVLVVRMERREERRE
jgi:hypothetical protein